MDTTRTAILVDFDLWKAHETVQRWIKLRENKASLVLLVTDPEHNDFDWENTDIPFDTPEWAAVMRNSMHLRDIAFKTSALVILQDSSNLAPVIALDDDLHVQQMYEDGGVLLAMGEKDLMYV